MRRSYCIGLDVHARFCEFVVATPTGRIVDSGSVATSIPELAQVVRSVRKPRWLVLEEGPLADWLYRQLSSQAEVTVCDPRRNRLIWQDGDKTDALDAKKLVELAQSGNLRPVYHPDSEARAAFKQLVVLYHDTVDHRVRIANQVIGYFRRWGVVLVERDFASLAGRHAALEALPRRGSVRADFDVVLDRYDQVVDEERRLRERVCRRARRIDPVWRFQAVPGMGPIRSATFYVYVDTPFRFPTKQKLWKYSGLGLEPRGSGQSERLRLVTRSNRILKGTLLGAAESAIRGENPFAEQYERWLSGGHKRSIAKRNVARSIEATLYGMWKSGTSYRPDRVPMPPSSGDFKQDANNRSGRRTRRRVASTNSTSR